MSFSETNPFLSANSCEAVRAEFSPYLDGAVSGVEMAAIAQHLDSCSPCTEEFAAWRSVQQALGQMGPAQPPVRLQARLRAAIAAERERGTHLPLGRRLLLSWRVSIAPLALRGAGGLAVALVLLGGLGLVFGAPVTVQANDDALTHLIAPRYLYSQVPPRPIEAGREVPILVEADVDTQGRVYDYSIVDGPHDTAVQRRVEENLLASVFKPATVFGIPVKGHVVMTYTGVSVRG